MVHEGWDDLTLERAARGLFALQHPDFRSGLSAWTDLLPSRKQQMRERAGALYATLKRGPP